LKIFISYAREDAVVAHEIALALRGGNHEVFIDTSSLTPGGEYHARIRESVSASDLFVFIVSPSSVEPGGYALSELKMAKAKWPDPWGYILPVLVRPTPFKQVDSYVTSVTLLQPAGNIAAEVAAEVEGLQHKLAADQNQPTAQECSLIAGLLTFLEDRRLLTADTGYQSHFPDHLRQSAEEIRQQTNLVLRQLPRDGQLAFVLKRLQEGARNFQESTEGARGAMHVNLPMGGPLYFQAIAEYRRQILTAIHDAAELCKLKLDERFVKAAERGTMHLLELAVWSKQENGV
jgi:TIR domain